MAIIAASLAIVTNVVILGAVTICIPLSRIRRSGKKSVSLQK